MNRITQRGLHVVMAWERFRTAPYADGFRADGSKILSIGFGHSNQLSDPEFDENSVWTLDYAREILLKDLEYFGGLLQPHLKIEVPDEIWSIFLSLAYNKGATRLYTSEQWKILHDGQEYHLERFCESILKYSIHAVNKTTGVMEEKRGLRWRRIAEAGIYLQDRSPNYL